jgi:hypothetical protein
MRCTRDGSENLVKNDVIWSDPCNKGEVTESSEDVVGNPSPNEHGQETVQEVSKS